MYLHVSLSNMKYYYEHFLGGLIVTYEFRWICKSFFFSMYAFEV